MVDCRTCKHHDIAVWYEENKHNAMHLCWLFEMVIKEKEIKNGDCECYVDVDCNLS